MGNEEQGAVDVSIVMPVLNEELTLPHCIENAKKALKLLESKNLTGEIVISDNDSTDGSASLASRLGARVVSCPERGYGRALIRGIKAARGRMIVIGDADGSYDFTDSIPMIEKLQEGFELCMGNRFAGGIMPGAMPFLNKHFGNPLLTGILNLLFRSGIGDAHCGLRAFTKEAFAKMRLCSRGMEFASEMVVRAALLKLRRTEVSITLHRDLRDKPPHLKPWRDGWRHLKFLMLSSPLWLYFIPSGLLITLSSFVFVALFLTNRYEVFSFGGLWIGDHWFILAGGLFTLGCNGILLGLAALIQSINHGHRKPSQLLLRIYKSITVEKGFTLGGLFFLIGIAMLVHVFLIWTSSNFGPMMRIRETVIATTFIVVGIQVFFSGFFLSSLKEDSNEEPGE
ncbi:MAG TPA: glycosyltransferase family 2 protein [Acidobacteriota bacterium]|nr:glycosyltransferase family 2 protein [Acidobacteriota bacterium]